MRIRWIARLLALALLLAALGGASGAALAEGFGDTPTSEMALGVGESAPLDISTLLVPEGQTIAYKTSDKRVATVDKDGVVTALRKGKATIAVGYDQTLLALCRLTVLAAPKGVKLSAKNVVLSVGDSAQLTATLPKRTASNLAFSSSNDAVAMVDSDGKVTAVSAGKVTVTVRTFNEKEAQCDVYVLGGKAPTTLSLNAASVTIQVGETFKVTPSVDEGSDAYYKYTSADKKIARVDADGVITGIRKGVTSIEVITHNGLRQTMVVSVKAALPDVYACLTNDPRLYAKYVKKLGLDRDLAASDSDSLVCRNDELALNMGGNYCQVALNDVDEPRYCVQGIDVTMSPEAAAAKLLANGWAQTGSRTSDGVEQRAYTRASDAGRFIAIATADGLTIQGIMAQWNW